MKKAGVLSIFLFVGFLASGQSVKGYLVDPVEGSRVRGATVQIIDAQDTTKNSFTISDSLGNFGFTGLRIGPYKLQASSIGFEFLQTTVNIADTLPDVDLGQVYLPKKMETLEGVIVVASPPAVVQKGDTTQFDAGQFKTNPDATTEDLIKKMPGITVDRQGNVTAQGESVKKVTVDGKDFFGDDATATLKNLPAEVVSKIQVFDRLSDQAQLTGFDDGNTQKSINIVTRSGVENSRFGQVFAGYGTNSRYSAGGNVNLFDGSRRVSLVANFNNVNQQNSSFRDILGARGGGGNDRGINKTSAFGINYNDKWGEKLNISGSYFYDNTFNDYNTRSAGQRFLAGDTTLFSNSSRISSSNNNNHQFNMRLEYNIDSNNTIYFIPSVGIQNNQSWANASSSSYYNDRDNDGMADSVNSSVSSSNAARNGYNIGNNLMYRHSFAKKGRSISLGLQANYNKNDGESFVLNNLKFYEDGIATDSVLNQFRDNNRNGFNYSARTSYTEPIGKQGQLQLEYNYSVQKNKADNETFEYDGSDYSIFVENYSNKFDNKITTNTAEVDYRIGRSRDNQFSVGVDFQNSRLESIMIYPRASSVDQSFNTILPNLRWSKKLGESSSFRLFYRARNDFPSIDQLQDVVDVSNPLNVSKGNPLLKQSYTHFMAGRYSLIKRQSGFSFFANIFGNITDNYIGNAVYIPRTADSLYQVTPTVYDTLKKGSQLVIPVNLDGFKQFRSYFTLSIPVKNILKSNINLNAGYNYTETPGMTNNIRTQTTNSIINGGLVWASNISEYIDFTLSYDASFGNVKSTISNASNNKYVNQTAGLFLNLLSKNGWFLQNDVSSRSNSGLTQGYNTSYWLWNAGLGKKFLKNNAGELKLSVFDLLKQNQSITRSVSGDFINDQETNVLRQYFMLTFTYRLKNFGKGSSNNSSDDRRREWRRDGDRPPGGYGPPGGGGRPGGPF